VQARTFEITFAGQAGKTLRAEFDDCQVSVGPGTTTLRAGLIDQGALQGLLQRITSLGLELLEVRVDGTMRLSDVATGRQIRDPSPATSARSIRWRSARTARPWPAAEEAQNWRIWPLTPQLAGRLPPAPNRRSAWFVSRGWPCRLSRAVTTAACCLLRRSSAMTACRDPDWPSSAASQCVPSCRASSPTARRRAASLM
jgi:hypothetical protein